MLSRKTLTAVLAVLGAVLGVIGTQFGLALNVAGLIAFLGAAVIYITGEAKADKLRMAAQKGKWKDPKFWIVMLTAIVTALPEAGVALPIDPGIINAVLAAIIGILFKVKPT